MNDKYVDFADADRVVDECGKVVMTDATIGVGQLRKWNCSLDYSGFVNAPAPEVIEAETWEDAFKQYLLMHPSTNAYLVVVEPIEDDK